MWRVTTAKFIHRMTKLWGNFANSYQEAQAAGETTFWGKLLSPPLFAGLVNGISTYLGTQTWKLR